MVKGHLKADVVVIGAGAVVGRPVPADSTVIGAKVDIKEDRPSSGVMPEWIAARMERESGLRADDRRLTGRL